MKEEIIANNIISAISKMNCMDKDNALEYIRMNMRSDKDAIIMEVIFSIVDTAIKKRET